MKTVNHQLRRCHLLVDIGYQKGDKLLFSNISGISIVLCVIYLPHAQAIVNILEMVGGLFGDNITSSSHLFHI